MKTRIITMEDTYIKAYRKLLKWRWADNPNMLALWIRLLLIANYEEKGWHNITVKRGQIVTSVAKLSAESGLSNKQVRLCLDKLKSTGEIKIEGANKYTIITICNYDCYQSNNEEQGQAKGKQKDEETANKGQTKGEQGANKGQTKGKQRATTKEREESKEREEGEEWKEGEEKNNLLSQRAREAEKFAPLNANDVAFADFYRRTFNTDFIWQENTSQSVQRIIDSIENTIRANGDIPDPATMPQYLTDFLNAVYRLNDKWLNERFNPQLIAKQYNQLYNRISNGAKSKQQEDLERYAKSAGVTVDFLQQLAAEVGGAPIF